jgi:nucleoside-diphosphate-sugar epimerase
MRVLVTGGAGYVGGELVDELLDAGHEVRALDVLLHGQEDVAERLESLGVELQRGDVRDPEARKRALEGVDAVVHLAAIVGDPACGRDPELSNAVNVEGTRGLVADAREAGVERFLFASTCSNYGRMADPTVPIDETGELRPVSLYAEQKVAMEKSLLEADLNGMSATCLRFATVYGVGHRMRFDLTVNEFTRDLWADRKLDVFGETFWRPYVHVRDAARAVALVLASPLDKVGRGDVEYVSRTEDPRDYKVSFERIKDELGFEPKHRVPTGIEELVGALEEERFGDPFSPRYSNIG